MMLGQRLIDNDVSEPAFLLNEVTPSTNFEKQNEKLSDNMTDMQKTLLRFITVVTDLLLNCTCSSCTSPRTEVRLFRAWSQAAGTFR